MSRMTIYDLRCECLSKPIGIHTQSPRLSWKLRSGKWAVTQTAYRIRVSSSLEKLIAGDFDLWDSGKIESGQSHLVEYEGAPLPSRLRAFWNVTVWDNYGSSATSSEKAVWEMGLIAAEDWKAEWIRADDLKPVNDPIVLDWCEQVVYRPIADGGYERERRLDEIAVEKREERIGTVKQAQPATWLRRSFTVQKPVAKARLYSAALGYSDLYLDGEKISDRVLGPAQTDYETRALYTTDVLDGPLSEGSHELRIHLAEGWYGQSHGFFDPHFRYGQPLALAQLEIEYTDDTRETISTDTQWESCPSPLAKANLYSGEVFDARIREDDLVWGPVVGPDVKQPLPERLEPQLLPPTCKADRITPESIIETSPGVYLVNMGINFAGWVSISLEAPRGTVVDLRYTEIVTPDNELDWAHDQSGNSE